MQQNSTMMIMMFFGDGISQHNAECATMSAEGELIVGDSSGTVHIFSSISSLDADNQTPSQLHVIDDSHNVSSSRHLLTNSLLLTPPTPTAPCRLRGCKNRPAPFPDRMSYKATRPGFVSLDFF